MTSGNPTLVTSRGCFAISHQYPRAGFYLSRYHDYPILIFAGHLTRKVIHDSVRYHFSKRYPGITETCSAECSQQLNPPAKFQHSAADGSSSTIRFTNSISSPWGPHPPAPTPAPAPGDEGAPSPAGMGGSGRGKSTGAGASSATLGAGGSWLCVTCDAKIEAVSAFPGHSLPRRS